MILPLNEIVTKINKRFRHRFPMPQVSEDSYVKFEVACPECWAILLVSSRGYSYSILVNGTNINQYEYEVYDKKDFGTALCGKYSAFL